MALPREMAEGAYITARCQVGGPDMTALLCEARGAAVNLTGIDTSQTGISFPYGVKPKGPSGQGRS